jgi:translocation and assembly module TamA
LWNQITPRTFAKVRFCKAMPPWCIALGARGCNNQDTVSEKTLPKYRLRRALLSVAVMTVALTAVPVGSFALESLNFSVVGGDKDLTKRLRTASALAGLETGQDAADEVFSAAKAEYGRLIGALYAAGYYSPVISVSLDGREASTIAPLDTPKTVNNVTVTVDPGPRFRFSQAEIAPLAPGNTLALDFQRGKVAQSDVVRQAVSAGVDEWRNVGHAKAEVAGQTVVADHAADTLAARVQLAPGPRLRFGSVAITGNERMRENRVRKIAGLPEGEVFSPAEIKRASERLRRTGTFQSVSITEADLITAPDLLGTTVTVVEEKLRRISFGAEISSLDGAEVSAAWTHRNLMGGAERLKVEGAVSNLGAPDSGVDYTLGLSLDRPATFTPDTTLRFATKAQRLDQEDYSADTFNVNIGVTQFYSDTLTFRGDIAFEYENGTALSTNKATSFAFLNRNVSLPLGVTWDRRNNKTDATTGFYIDAEVKPFYSFTGSGSGARLYTDMRAYRGFGAEDRFVLAGRFQVGAVFGADLLEARRDDLFYSGGGGTVRGQPYQSLGVNVTVGGDTFKIGGTHFVGASFEARAKVTPKIGVVGFVDAGRVDVDGFFQSAGDWHAGAGLGLRYDTGFGPIRLDIAAPVGGSTGKGGQIYVGLGQAF